MALHIGSHFPSQYFNSELSHNHVPIFLSFSLHSFQSIFDSTKVMTPTMVLMMMKELPSFPNGDPMLYQSTLTKGEVSLNGSPPVYFAWIQLQR